MRVSLAIHSGNPASRWLDDQTELRRLVLRDRRQGLHGARKRGSGRRALRDGACGLQKNSALNSKAATTMTEYPNRPYLNQRQPMPGSTAKMDPRPDHGEKTYKGSGRLQSTRAIITGGDSGIDLPITVVWWSKGPSENSAGSISSSTTQRIRQPSRTSATSARLRQSRSYRVISR
jgi:hypothetical protein